MGLLMKVIAWFLKNMALMVGILEALAKVITGIISLTPTKEDDKWLPKIDAVFSEIKRWLYTIATALSKGNE